MQQQPTGAMPPAVLWPDAALATEGHAGVLCCDAVVAGGGPAGAVAAWALACAGWRVLLVDHSPPERFKVGEGLPPAGCSLLRQLGLWSAVQADAHRPAHANLSYWGSDHAQVHDFLFQLHGHGVQLDRGRFDARLRQQAQAAGAQLRLQTRLVLTHPDPQAPAHRLQLWPSEGGAAQTVLSRWLVDATGRSATLARQLGAQRHTFDRLMACFLRLQSSQGSDEDGNTWVEAVPEGWWYSVLLPNRQRLLAFLTDSDGADRRRLLHTDGLWASLLQNTRHLRQLCAHHEYHPGTTPAQGADASSACLDQCAAANWIAVGDAAAAFDPLSSKGIAHAIYTGHQAAMALIKTEQTHHPHALMAYDDHIHAIFTHYRHHLRLAYQTETRWPQARFWSSRGGDVLKSRSSK